MKLSNITSLDSALSLQFNLVAVYGSNCKRLNMFRLRRKADDRVLIVCQFNTVTLFVYEFENAKELTAYLLSKPVKKLRN